MANGEKEREEALSELHRKIRYATSLTFYKDAKTRNHSDVLIDLAQKLYNLATITSRFFDQFSLQSSFKIFLKEGSSLIDLAIKLRLQSKK